MGLRFRKTVKLFPGVKLNISRSGISTSLGVDGATVNVKQGRKSRATVGLPGTGISYSETIKESGSTGSSVWRWLLVFIAFAAAYKFFS